MAKQAPLTLAVGDHVRLRSRDGNQHQSYRTSAAEVTTYREAIDGLVLSIRDVKSGQLVAASAGDITNYVVELVYTRSFNPRFASTRNAPRGVDDPTTTGAYRKLRATLRKDAAAGTFYSTATPNLQTSGPLATLLDGWKVVKVWSDNLENLEKAEPPQEAPAE